MNCGPPEACEVLPVKEGFVALLWLLWLFVALTVGSGVGGGEGPRRVARSGCPTSYLVGLATRQTARVNVSVRGYTCG